MAIFSDYAINSGFLTALRLDKFLNVTNEYHVIQNIYDENKSKVYMH